MPKASELAVAEQELCTHSNYKQLATALVFGTMTSTLWSHGHKCFFGWSQVTTPVTALSIVRIGVATLFTGSLALWSHDHRWFFS